MARPTNKGELLEAMAREYELLLTEIEAVDPGNREVPGACEEWSIKDILGHLYAWHEMFLQWEAAGAAGETIEMPAPGYTWKDTPALNEAIYQRMKDVSYEDNATNLAASHAKVSDVVSSYTDEDLSTKRRYKWTGSTSVLSYAVSATSSHYDWARNLIRKFKKTL